MTDHQKGEISHTHDQSDGMTKDRPGKIPTTEIHEEDEEGKTEPHDAPRDSENLDEGLEESMDGSDPPSTTQP